MPAQYDDPAGPTAERLRHAGQFFAFAGHAKSSRRYTMLDDALGRALVRQQIEPEEYLALKLYALHWLAGGLQGHLNSVDLNRVLAFDPARMTGLAKTEAQADHRRLYHQARESIGRRPAFVADQVACVDAPMAQVARGLGYRSAYWGRCRVVEILRDAGSRLITFWEELAKRN
jgi:hypothetical protein